MSTEQGLSAWISAARPSLSDLLSLVRPRLAVLGLIMVVLSYVLAGPTVGLSTWLNLAALLVGSFLILCGSSALNQVMERDVDARMRRTMARPLPAGRIAPRFALHYGLLLSGFGALVLGLGVNALTAILALMGEMAYLLIYTPLKPHTSLSTLVGAGPGAVPVLMGWAGARGRLDLEAWVLFAILFLWQLPHFLAIAWMYREDYERAGLRMLGSVDPEGDVLARQVLVYGLALIPVSLLPTLVGLTGPAYFVGALLLGLYYFRAGLRLAGQRDGQSGRLLLRASVLYLPALFALMVLDHALS